MSIDHNADGRKHTPTSRKMTSSEEEEEEAGFDPTASGSPK
jgi:hypothetical protein